jgi:GT2 family glycosyltransferase
MPHEIIIVDGDRAQRAKGALEEKFTERFNSIKYINTEPGLTHQRNIGVKNASGEIIFFFDDDVLPAYNYIEEVMNIFNEDKSFEVAAVTGNMVKPVPFTGLSLRRIVEFLFFLNMLGNGNYRLSGLPTAPFGLRGIRKIEFVPGHTMAYRRDVFNEFMFDEEQFRGTCQLEDVDFSYRVSRKHQCLYTSDARCVHTLSKHMRQPEEEKRKEFIENYKYYFKKNIPKNLLHIIAYRIALFALVHIVPLLQKNPTLKTIVEYDLTKLAIRVPFPFIITVIISFAII